MLAGTKPMKALLAACELPNAKVVRTVLPNGATECTVAGGPRMILMRSFPMGTQTCVVAATRATGELSTDDLRSLVAFAPGDGRAS